MGEGTRSTAHSAPDWQMVSPVPPSTRCIVSGPPCYHQRNQQQQKAQQQTTTNETNQQHHEEETPLATGLAAGNNRRNEMIARTPFDAPTLTPLDALDLTALPPGTTEAYALNGTTFYRVSWLLAVRAGAVSYVGEADSASAQLERLAEIERQLLDLQAEHDGLMARLMPPVAPETPKPVPAPKTAKPAPPAKTPVRCAVDGCEDEKSSGTAIAMHRKQKHPDWFTRQIALPDDHLLKADRTGAIVRWEAAQTDQLPPVKELPVVPMQEVAPEVPVAPEAAPVIPFDQSPA